VVRAEALPADLVTAQLETLAGDLSIDAVKTGMLADAAIVEAVGAAIQELDLPNLVVDPVIASSGGVRLLDADGVQSMISELFPRARVITPNVPEAEALSGRRIASLADARDAARRLHAMGPAAVIVTGGHARWPGREGQVIDLLFDGRAFVELRTRRVAAGLHGTGCAFASAVTAALAMGAPIEDAAAGAQRYVARLLAHPLAIGRGGALDHMRLARRR
jgi:hydroxymethylpyrimidine/phosphomethylpyrimidine kinase